MPPCPSPRARASPIGEIVRSFHLERAEMRIPAHQHDLEHRVVERERRFLRNHRDPLRERPPRHARYLRGIESHDAGLRRARTPASSRSSVVLPDPFGPRMPTMSPAAMSSETPVVLTRASRAVAESEDQRPIATRTPTDGRSARAPDSQARLRSRDRARFVTRAYASSPAAMRNDPPTSATTYPGFVRDGRRRSSARGPPSRRGRSRPDSSCSAIAGVAHVERPLMTRTADERDRPRCTAAARRSRNCRCRAPRCRAR